MPERIVEAMKRMAKDPDFRREKAEATVRYVMTEFQLDPIVTLHEGLYLRILGNLHADDEQEGYRE